MKKKKIKRLVESGLFILAGLTLLSSPLEAQENRGGAVPRETLSVSLKRLDIKDHFIVSTSPIAGEILALKGHVVIIHGGTGIAFFGREGDVVYEKDTINTLENSRCQIKFSTDDVVKLGADTEFGVETYVDDRSGGSKTSIFTMLKGKAKFYALRLLRYRKKKFEVKTPTAVVGVRGTKFGLHVYWEEESKMGKGGVQVADNSKEIGNYIALLEPVNGKKSYTDSHCDEGEIDQNGIIIPAGFGYREQTGDLGPMDPIERDAFDAEISAIENEQEIREEQNEAPGTQKSIEEGAGEKGFPADRIATQSDMTHNMNPPDPTLDVNPPDPTLDVHPPDPNLDVNPPVAQRPAPAVEGNQVGYFTALMNRSSPTTSLHDVYVTSTRQDFNSASVRGESIVYPGGFIENNPEGFLTEGTPYLRRIVTDGGATDSGDSATGSITIPAEWDDYSYMTWGRWTMNDPVTIDGHEYTVDDIARYIFGQTTPNETVAGFSGPARYSGNAYGTYVGDVFMHGDFSCNVNFDSGSVNNFDLDVSSNDNSHGAHIVDAFGSLNGSEFNLSGGTWSLEKEGGTKTPAYQGLQGSLFGPNAEETGGVWGMYYNDEHAATGVFLGNKQTVP
jgi:hypothetical protein